MSEMNWNVCEDQKPPKGKNGTKERKKKSNLFFFSPFFPAFKAKLTNKAEQMTREVIPSIFFLHFISASQSNTVAPHLFIHTPMHLPSAQNKPLGTYYIHFPCMWDIKRKENQNQKNTNRRNKESEWQTKGFCGNVICNDKKSGIFATFGSFKTRQKSSQAQVQFFDSNAVWEMIFTFFSDFLVVLWHYEFVATEVPFHLLNTKLGKF